MNLHNFGQASCKDCCDITKLQGCANGVPYLLEVNTSVIPAITTYINLNTGVVSTTPPANFDTGDCPAIKDYEIQILCDAGNNNTPFLRVIALETQTGTVVVNDTALDGVTPYTAVSAQICTQEKFDFITNNFCDNGVSIIGIDIMNVSGLIPVLVTTIFRNSVGAIIVPSGNQVLGLCTNTLRYTDEESICYTVDAGVTIEKGWLSFIKNNLGIVTATNILNNSGAIVLGATVTDCKVNLLNRGIQIADGTHVANLGPNGTSYTLTGLEKSITIKARKSNTTNSTNGAANIVLVNFNNGTYIGLLEGEIISWSIEDINSMGGIVDIICQGNSAALINITTV